MASSGTSIATSGTSGTSGTGGDAPPPPLSRRETAVLEMVAAGLTNAEAARRMGVSVHAIKFHLASIYRKLSVSNRTEAAVWLLGQTQTASSTEARIPLP